jgi:hypothetical protein
VRRVPVNGRVDGLPVDSLVPHRADVAGVVAVGPESFEGCAIAGAAKVAEGLTGREVSWENEKFVRSGACVLTLRARVLFSGRKISMCVCMFRIDSSSLTHSTSFCPGNDTLVSM